MQLILSSLSIVYLNMFLGSLRPTSGEEDCVQPHMVFSTGCAGRGCVQLGRKPCAYGLLQSFTQPRPAQPVLNTICSSTQSCSDDGRNNARNMLR